MSLMLLAMLVYNNIACMYTSNLCALADNSVLDYCAYWDVRCFGGRLKKTDNKTDNISTCSAFFGVEILQNTRKIWNLLKNIIFTYLKVPGTIFLKTKKRGLNNPNDPSNKIFKVLDMGAISS